MADTRMIVVLMMHFFNLSNVDVEFAEIEKLTWGSYTTVENLPTTSRVELIDEKNLLKRP